MRPMLVFAILMLGLGGAAPEVEYASFIGDYFHKADGGALPSLVEIESSTRRADRLSVAILQPRALPVEILKPGIMDPTPASASTDGGSNRATEVSLDGLCNAMLTSAQDNDLPIPFFANLIWQESRLRDDAVSPKGAMGIAQFMPETAAESGLDDPFDPLQAIPASARLLNELRLQFGNLGFVAAAYNAGARRVAEWLEHRRSLPRETRGYVVHVTGLSVDAWRSMPVDDTALTFVRRLPCRSLPAFASIEQEQLEQAQLEQSKLEQAKFQEPPTEVAPTPHAAPKHVADPKHGHGRHQAHRAAHDTGRREAEHHSRAAPEKRRSA